MHSAYPAAAAMCVRAGDGAAVPEADAAGAHGRGEGRAAAGAGARAVRRARGGRARAAVRRAHARAESPDVHLEPACLVTWKYHIPCMLLNAAWVEASKMVPFKVVWLVLLCTSPKGFLWFICL